MGARFGASGFSLIELMVVLAVLAVLAVAVTPMVEVSLQRERERELKRALWEIRDAIDAYKEAAEKGQIDKVGSNYPMRLEDLVVGVPAQGGAGLVRRYFLRRVPRDPFSDGGVQAAPSWGLRSYASPPDRPEQGADVFDVYSQSPRIGLNGVPLKDW